MPAARFVPAAAGGLGADVAFRPPAPGLLHVRHHRRGDEGRDRREHHARRQPRHALRTPAFHTNPLPIPSLPFPLASAAQARSSRPLLCQPHVATRCASLTRVSPRPPLSPFQARTAATPSLGGLWGRRSTLLGPAGAQPARPLPSLFRQLNLPFHPPPRPPPRGGVPPASPVLCALQTFSSPPTRKPPQRPITHHSHPADLL